MNIEPFGGGDRRDRLRPAREVRLDPADWFAADRAAGEQRPAPHLALGRFVDADRRIIEGVADLACRGEAREPVDGRTEHEIARAGRRRGVAHQVDEFRREWHPPILQIAWLERGSR